MVYSYRVHGKRKKRGKKRKKIKNIHRNFTVVPGGESDFIIIFFFFIIRRRLRRVDICIYYTRIACRTLYLLHRVCGVILFFHSIRERAPVKTFLDSTKKKKKNTLIPGAPCHSADERCFCSCASEKLL